MQAKVNDKIYDIELVSKDGNKVQLKINGKIIEIDVALTETGFCSILHNNHSYNAECVNPEDGKYIITANFRRYEIELQNLRKKYVRSDTSVDDYVQDCIKAPMPGKIMSVLVASGQMVKKGDALVVIEAMKMQSTYTASQDATVEKVEVEEGDAVLADQLLISFKHHND
ncbi:MAG: acetyl-CoA carboxylase biotin carboxyl carrier protein subunit [Bacteroides sp.]|nr:acetyl-CoA carboxylase biotin carboxyl carrier protein subunit [Bacteroides sp.]MCM1390152.1 acetyl-CoA carboxylase biotin carboxyl carrier protein subunit [Bacteroides sp.]